MNPDALQRLRAGGTDRLVDLLLDDLLDRPIEEMIDVPWLSRQLAAAARSASKDPRLETLIRERVADARGRVGRGPVPMPREIRAPMREMLARGYVPDRELIGKLLDHDTARLMLKHIFQDLLSAIVRKLKAPAQAAQAAVKSPLPFGRLQKIGERLGGEMRGVLGHEVERVVEEKAREVMDASLNRLVEVMADHLCDPEMGAAYAAWRVHMMDVLLSTDQRKLAGEVEKLDPDNLVATSVALARALVARPELDGELEGVLRAATEQTDGRSLRHLLGGLEEHGIDVVRDLLRQRARAVVETPGFAAWWDDVVGT